MGQSKDLGPTLVFWRDNILLSLRTPTMYLKKKTHGRQCILTVRHRSPSSGPSYFCSPHSRLPKHPPTPAVIPNVDSSHMPDFFYVFFHLISLKCLFGSCIWHISLICYILQESFLNSLKEFALFPLFPGMYVVI